MYFEAQVPLAKKNRLKGKDGERAGAGERSIDAHSLLTPGKTPLRVSTADAGKEDENTDEERPLFCVETAAW